MRKIRKLISAALCVLVLTVTITFSCPVNAKTAGYKKLYNNFLSNSTIPAGNYTITPNWYYVINIDRTGVPELIVTSSGGAITGYCVYTVKKGKVKFIGEYGAKGISYTNPTFSYIKKYKGLVASGWTNGIGGAWNNMYKKSKYKLVQKKHLMSENSGLYYGKTTETRHKVSKKAFMKYYKKYFKPAKEYKMKKNTAANRKKSF